MLVNVFNYNSVQVEFATHRNIERGNTCLYLGWLLVAEELKYGKVPFTNHFNTDIVKINQVCEQTITIEFSREIYTQLVLNISAN